MALVILLAWGADSETIDRLGDLVSYLHDYTDNASKLILSLGAAALIVLSLIVIVVELVPAAPAAQVRLGGVTGGAPTLPIRPPPHKGGRGGHFSPRPAPAHPRPPSSTPFWRASSLWPTSPWRW